MVVLERKREEGRGGQGRADGRLVWRGKGVMWKGKEEDVGEEKDNDYGGFRESGNSLCRGCVRDCALGRSSPLDIRLDVCMVMFSAKVGLRVTINYLTI